MTRPRRRGSVKLAQQDVRSAEFFLTRARFVSTATPTEKSHFSEPVQISVNDANPTALSASEPGCPDVKPSSQATSMTSPPRPSRTVLRAARAVTLMETVTAASQATDRRRKVRSIMPRWSSVTAAQPPTALTAFSKRRRRATALAEKSLRLRSALAVRLASERSRTILANSVQLTAPTAEKEAEFATFVKRASISIKRDQAPFAPRCLTPSALTIMVNSRPVNTVMEGTF